MNEEKKKRDALEETTYLLDKTACAERPPSHKKAFAIAIVTRCLNHLVITDVDSHVMDCGGAVSKEHQITRLTLRKRVLGCLIELILSVVRERLPCSLVNGIKGKTAAIKTNNIAVITEGLFCLLCSLGGSIYVTSIPRIRILSNHALSSLHNLLTSARRWRLRTDTTNVVTCSRAKTSLLCSFGARRLGHACSLVAVAGNAGAASKSAGSRARTGVSGSGAFSRTHAKTGVQTGDAHTTLDVRASRTMTGIRFTALLGTGRSGNANTTANSRHGTEICG